MNYDANLADFVRDTATLSNRVLLDTTLGTARLVIRHQPRGEWYSVCLDGALCHVSKTLDAARGYARIVANREHLLGFVVEASPNV